MEFKIFEKIISSYKSFWDKIRQLDDMGFDFYEGKFKLMEDVEYILDSSFRSHYNDDGVDWIYWFMFENDFGNKDWNSMDIFYKKEKKIKLGHGAFDENKKPICYSIKSTWKYVEENCKKVKIQIIWIVSKFKNKIL